MDPAMAGGPPMDPGAGGPPVVTPEMMDQVLGLLEEVAAGMDRNEQIVQQQAQQIEELTAQIEEVDAKASRMDAIGPVAGGAM